MGKFVLRASGSLTGLIGGLSATGYAPVLWAFGSALIRGDLTGQLERSGV